MHPQLQTTPYRSKMMSKIRSTGGKTEVLLAKMLWHREVRYRRNFKKLPGKPDIAITKYKIAVFVDGEFWHGWDWENQKQKRIHRNRSYWIAKIEGNMRRDKLENEELKRMGWQVIRFWEKHEILKDPDACVEKIMYAIEHRVMAKKEN